MSSLARFLPVGFRGGPFRLPGPPPPPPYRHTLIITAANLFCSMHSQMNINATEAASTHSGRCRLAAELGVR